MTFSDTYYIAEIMVRNKGTGYVDMKRNVVFEISKNCFHNDLCSLRETVNDLMKNDKFHDIENVVYKKVACNYVW